MESHLVRINAIKKVTHDVLGITTDKPESYNFTPGQATEVSINKEGWKEERRPFTFTSLPTNEQLEFTIKTYPSHDGVTNQLLQLSAGDELVLHDVWGAIAYKGRGTFIAGGAGITPFLSIFRDLQTKDKVAGNKLIFANKSKADIIYEEELNKMLGEGFVNILSDEKAENYAKGRITKDFIEMHGNGVDEKFYVCGPPAMMKAVQGFLDEMGVKENALVIEV